MLLFELAGVGDFGLPAAFQERIMYNVNAGHRPASLRWGKPGTIVNGAV